MVPERGFFLGMALSAAAYAASAAMAPVDQVDPRIGTGAEGQTFPATGVPFGMTQWTPQTREGEAKCVAPYYQADSRIQGFRGSHFASGSCMQEYGSMTVMALTGDLKLGQPSAPPASIVKRSAPGRTATTWCWTITDRLIPFLLSADEP